jgi:alpha-beta hydrolase superfamily lysophospholipase
VRQTKFHVGYFDLLDDASLNFQLNRWIGYRGETMLRDIRGIASRLTSYPAWIGEFLALAERTLADGRPIDAALCLRSAEFFMPPGDARRRDARGRFIELMREGYGIREAQLDRAPFTAIRLPFYRLTPDRPKDVVVVFGGFDSYIEEFFPLLCALRDSGLEVVGFEGPGQGSVLEDARMPMTPDWHAPVGAVLDHLKLEKVTLVGISLGGCLAIRAAAREKRIERVVAFDVMSDFLECMLGQASWVVRALAPRMIQTGAGVLIDAATARLARRRPVVEWGLRQARRVFGASTDHAALEQAARYHTRDVSRNVTQDVLLLAGAEDHYVPVHQLYDQARSLTAARSVTTRLFTKLDSAQSHCQVGNFGLALATIVDWVDQMRR